MERISGSCSEAISVPPALSSTPTQFSDCCLSLSTTLFTSLRRLITDVVTPKTRGGSSDWRVISIGSGTGLFEACLRSEFGPASGIIVEGVEVPSTRNKYLPQAAVHRVLGTWDICTEVANTSQVWIFVYPREPKLVQRYFRYAENTEYASNVRLIIWLGPRNDWSQFKQCFDARIWKFHHIGEQENFEESLGTSQYETMKVLMKDV